MIKNRLCFSLLIAAAVLGASPTASAKKKVKVEPLKTTVGKYIQIGVALNDSITWGKDKGAVKIVQEHFNCAEPENCMKAEKIHPRNGYYFWDDADQFVKFCEDNSLTCYGHCLVWHSQAAHWMFKDDNGSPINRPQMIQRMRDHIYTIVGRYKGRVKGWDVVNEAVEDNGNLRDTLYCKYIGPDFIKLAFQFAHEADPDAELYINDYSMAKPAKRATYLRIVKELKEAGLRIDGVGMQSHNGIDYPDLAEYEKSIEEFSKLGVKVMMTELDLNMLPAPPTFQGADVGQSFEYQQKYNPYTKGLTEEAQKTFDDRYRAFFEIYSRHRDVIDRINFWNVSDGDSWMNDWPMKGRTAYPTLFDRNHQPKSVVKEINEMFK